MRWPTRSAEKAQLVAALSQHSNNVRPLQGIMDPVALDTLATQFIASLRREDYYSRVQQKKVSADRADPNNPAFDAERAVAYHLQAGNIEEAAWLVFLMTHLARPADTGWLRLKDIYGKRGQGIWTWEIVSADPAAFSDWVYANANLIRGKFGNHRKYESLEKGTKRELSKVLKTYIDLVGPSQRAFFADAVRIAGNDPQVIFDHLYRKMGAVFSFGRLAKFDYLSLIGRYGVAPISSGSAYLTGATGPASGAKLLFFANPDAQASPKQLQALLDELDLSIGVGMAVMEDALCNWQKSPTEFIHFTG
ncbi:hypothetical protein B5K08_09550 [Rhizobium leguminosarum bv. trifolii]|uniref:Alpha-glutamyl/putrescinyl thymine pyrophosphorylase clade 3 domain-containing protein n=2 Tax=Rhizobium leguminosarum TaxID=384 RepID=A0A3E1BPU1_RHILT|nr:hypothetical protein B5K08_09550 [Rhizobium leguminosarum bv. trifolii]RFB95799.1 hypothetical protein B5K10_09535 [Rhizobium leguminosarum bv. trifolii]